MIASDSEQNELRGANNDKSRRYLKLFRRHYSIDIRGPKIAS